MTAQSAATAERFDSKHFRTVNKIKTKDDTPETIKELTNHYNTERPKDSYPKNMRMYYRPIFSRTSGSYNMDIFENPKVSKIESQELKTVTTQYILIFININTRYAVGYPMNNKDSKTVLEHLREFVDKYKPSKITSDNDRAFVSKEVVNFLNEKGVGQYIVTQHNHTSLGIIDRFMRTLRDMNRVRTIDNKDSEDEEFKYLSIPKLNILLDEYNNAEHSSIRMSPIDMQNNDRHESMYILNKMHETDFKTSMLKDFELKDNMFVRVIMTRKNIEKKRYKVSPEALLISGRKGNLYILRAKDGSIIEVPRWRIILAGTEPNKLDKRYKWRESVNNDSFGIIEKIIDYDEKTDKYLVKYEGVKKKEWLPVRNLREGNPGKMTEREKEFFKKQIKNGQK